MAREKMDWRGHGGFFKQDSKGVLMPVDRDGNFLPVDEDGYLLPEKTPAAAPAAASPVKSVTPSVAVEVPSPTENNFNFAAEDSKE